MILFLSESDVTTVVSMADAISAVERAHKHHTQGSSIVVPRTSTTVPGESGAFRVMSAILPKSGFFGLKTLTGSPGRRLPGETYFAILLFSCETGALRAVIAANQLTGIRTGAASGVAAKYLARPDSRVLGIIGSGVQARYQAAALAAVCPLEEIRVFSRNPQKAEALARSISAELHVAARATRDAREAVAGTDLVVTVTTASAPVFDGQWLSAGSHVSGVGSNAPGKRELDDVTLRRSRIVVDFKDQVLQEAGDIQRALAAGAIDDAAVSTELGDLASGKAPGRRDDQEITLFKSVGMAIQDIAVAAFAYERSLALGIGMRFEADPSTVMTL